MNGGAAGRAVAPVGGAAGLGALAAENGAAGGVNVAEADAGVELPAGTPGADEVMGAGAFESCASEPRLSADAEKAGVRRGATSPDGGVAGEVVVGAAVAGPAGADEAAGDVGATVAVAELIGGADLNASGAGADLGAGTIVLAGVEGADGTGREANSGAASAPREIVITPPHTEQRARTLPLGSLSGSTRKTERHSGQTTFMPSLPSTRRSPDR